MGQRTDLPPCACGACAPSTGPSSHAADMSNRHRFSGHTSRHTPYDDVIAAERRWGRLHPDELDAAARADPLRFMADHLSSDDRRRGSVALYGDLGHRALPILVAVPDAPPDPTFEECALLVGTFASHVADTSEAMGSRAFGVGLVHHRTGTAVVSDHDRRWLLAVESLAPTFGYAVVGVMARTSSGALVQVTPRG